MSSAEVLNPNSSDSETRHLELVPSLEDQSEHQVDINDQISTFVQALEGDFVPQSKEEAQDVINGLTRLNGHAQVAYLKGSEVAGSQIDEDALDVLNDIVGQGIDYWKLSTQERQELQVALSADSLHALPARLQSVFKNRFNESADEYVENNATANELIIFKEGLKNRLSLDAAIGSTDEKAQKQEKNLKRPGDIGGVKPAKHTTSQPAEDAPTEQSKQRPVRTKAKTIHTTAASGTQDSKVDSHESTNTTTQNDFKHEAISDLVRVGKSGATAHRPDGKFLSNTELESIKEHADQIRDGVSERERILKLRENSKKLMIRMYGQDEYAERFATNPNVDPDAWQAVEYGTGPEKAEIPDDVDEAIWKSLPTEVQGLWNTLNDDEKQSLVDFQAQQKAEQSPFERSENGSLQLKGAKERHGEIVAADPNTPVPVIDSTPKGLRARFNQVLAWGFAKKEQTKDYFTDTEKGKRRKVIGAVIGAGALIGAGAAIYLESRGGGVSHHTAGANQAPKVRPITPKPPAGIPKNYQEVTLKPGSGDSLWSEERLHHPSLSEHAILERVKRDMVLNHIPNEQAAEHMSGKVKITR